MRLNDSELRRAVEAALQGEVRDQLRLPSAHELSDKQVALHVQHACGQGGALRRRRFAIAVRAHGASVILEGSIASETLRMAASHGRRARLLLRLGLRGGREQAVRDQAVIGPDTGC